MMNDFNELVAAPQNSQLQETRIFGICVEDWKQQRTQRLATPQRIISR